MEKTFIIAQFPRRVGRCAGTCWPPEVVHLFAREAPFRGINNATECLSGPQLLVASFAPSSGRESGTHANDVVICVNAIIGNSPQQRPRAQESEGLKESPKLEPPNAAAVCATVFHSMFAIIRGGPPRADTNPSRTASSPSDPDSRIRWQLSPNSARTTFTIRSELPQNSPIGQARGHVCLVGSASASCPDRCPGIDASRRKTRLALLRKSVQNEQETLRERLRDAICVSWAVRVQTAAVDPVGRERPCSRRVRSNVTDEDRIRP